MFLSFWMVSFVLLDNQEGLNNDRVNNLQLKEVLNDERIIGIDWRYSNICKLINEIWILKDYSKKYE